MTQTRITPEFLLSQIKTETGQGAFIGLVARIRHCFQGVHQVRLGDEFDFTHFDLNGTQRSLARIDSQDSYYQEWLKVDNTNLAATLLLLVLEEIDKGTEQAQAMFTSLLYLGTTESKSLPPQS